MHISYIYIYACIYVCIYIYIYDFWKKFSGQKLAETIGLRFRLRFWRGVLRFCLRFPICAAFVCCLLSAAAAASSLVAYLLASTDLLHGFLICWSLLLGPAGYWSHFLLTFALRFAYVFLTLNRAHTKPNENHCLANGNVKNIRKHIRIHTTGFELCTCCFCWLWNSTPLKVTKTNQKR